MGSQTDRHNLASAQQQQRWVVWWGWELDEGNQKVETSGYNISTKDVTYNMTNIVSDAVHYI